MKPHKIIILFGLLLCMGLVQAQDAKGKHSAPPYSFSGVFQFYDSKTNMILVDALQFTLASNVVVHTPGLTYQTVSDLKAKQKIGLSFNKDQITPQVVDAIWILPEQKYQQR